MTCAELAILYTIVKANRDCPALQLNTTGYTRQLSIVNHGSSVHYYRNNQLCYFLHGQESFSDRSYITNRQCSSTKCLLSNRPTVGTTRPFHRSLLISFRTFIFFSQIGTLSTQGNMRIAPSSLIVSPLSIGFSTASWQKWANSSGMPNLCGNGTSFDKIFLILSGISIVIAV